MRNFDNNIERNLPDPLRNAVNAQQVQERRPAKDAESIGMITGTAIGIGIAYYLGLPVNIQSAGGGWLIGHYSLEYVGKIMQERDAAQAGRVL